MAALIVVTTELALPLWPFACRPSEAAALSIDELKIAEEDVTGIDGTGEVFLSCLIPPSITGAH